jgi:hypothetical protein
MLKHVLLTGTAAIALVAISIPARADNIGTNSWYTGHFAGSGTSLGDASEIAVLNITDPVLRNPTNQPVDAATSIADGLLSATISSQHHNFLLATDGQTSGDRFQLFVDGNAATPDATSATTMVSSGLQPDNDLAVNANALGGVPSSPVAGDRTCGIVSCALAGPDYSSGPFYLPAGQDTNTGKFTGNTANRDTDLFVGPAPRADSLTLFATGLLGLGAAIRRRRSREAAPHGADL